MTLLLFSAHPWHFIILFHQSRAGGREAWSFPAQHLSLLPQKRSRGKEGGRRREGEQQPAYPQEGEVSVVLDAGDLQVAHHHLTVLIILAQGPVLLLQVRQGAQLVLSASTHCKKTTVQSISPLWKRGTGAQ